MWPKVCCGSETKSATMRQGKIICVTWGMIENCFKILETLQGGKEKLVGVLAPYCVEEHPVVHSGMHTPVKMRFKF